METLIVHLDKTVSKSKVKETLKMLKGIGSVSEKLTRSDYEALADNVLVREMKRADKAALLTFHDGKKEFENLKKGLRK